MAYSPAMEHRELDESLIRSIPVFQFKKGGNTRDFGEGSFSECAVCLNKFHEDEKLRMIPNCGHVFYCDCIDVWLRNNANCPLCRTSISSTSRLSINQTVAPSLTPQGPNPYFKNIISRDEDFVVIELGNLGSTDQILLGAQERLNLGDRSARLLSPSPRKWEQRIVQKKARKFNIGTSLGDECIDVIRDKDERFAIQPIRRSISMDSSADRQLYLAVQEAKRQKRQVNNEFSSPIEGCSSSRLRRSSFSFGHGRGSKSAVWPVYLEP